MQCICGSMWLAASPLPPLPPEATSHCPRLREGVGSRRRATSHEHGLWPPLGVQRAFQLKVQRWMFGWLFWCLGVFLGFWGPKALGPKLKTLLLNLGLERATHAPPKWRPRRVGAQTCRAFFFSVMADFGQTDFGQTDFGQLFDRLCQLWA